MIFLLLFVLFLLSWLISIRFPSVHKLSPYECGLEPIGNTNIKFHIIYFILAILYLLFDLEIVLLYPLVLSLSWISFPAFLALFSFLFFLTISFLFEWYQGALEIS